MNAQNAQFAAGKVGQEPVAGSQSMVYTVTAHGRLVEPEEFGNIVLRSDPNGGGVLRLKDVARLELGAISYDAFTMIDGKDAVGIAVFLQSGANALATANLVRAKMDELTKSFPQGVRYLIPFDTTSNVQASIHEVIVTLLIAAFLVMVVVYVFLQSWRALLIPMVAVPISLIGAFAGLYIFGFSINTVTLFAIVLATGIVVDDAIVVLENVERLMAEKGLSPRDASIESMREVMGAIVAIVLVLCSVFIPVAFLGGIAGKLYQQFAVTVVTSVVISGVVALTLTPALCALLLKPAHQESALFRPFNRSFLWLTHTYTRIVAWVLKHAIKGLIGFVIVLAAVVGLLKLVPGSFVPPEDLGYILGSVILPDGATLGRTAKVGAGVQQILAEQEGVAHSFLINGFDLIGGGNKTNTATLFINLKDWDERKVNSTQIARQVMGKGAAIRDGLVLAFNPPPIRGLGTAGGLEFYLQDRGGANSRRLADTMLKFQADLAKNKDLTGINVFFPP
ncbi:MAG: efflux RND transporter permease subunit [Rhodospirillales bacterium]